MLLTSLIFVERVCRRDVLRFSDSFKSYPSFRGNDPPQSSIFWRRRHSCAASWHITGEGGAVIIICIVAFSSSALVSLHACGS